MARHCPSCVYYSPEWENQHINSITCRNPDTMSVNPASGHRTFESCGYNRTHPRGKCHGGIHWTHPVPLRTRIRVRLQKLWWRIIGAPHIETTINADQRKIGHE